MVVKGYNTPWSVKAWAGKLEMLDKSKLANKSRSIYSCVLFSKEGQGSVSILYLSPKAGVKKHRHTNDSEIYIFWDLKNQRLQYEICKKGNTHELKNISEKRWAVVLSIKFESESDK
ncbi:MAG: hypothetical protein IJH12_07790 [Clostridia bacterium]|nr:hypothetical protein [Clostridia bacterium]